MRSIVCHKVVIDEHNPELGGTLQHAGVCDCNSIVFSVKVCIPKAYHKVALLYSRASILLNGMLHFLRIDLMRSFKRYFCPPALLWPSLSWP